MDRGRHSGSDGSQMVLPPEAIGKDSILEEVRLTVTNSTLNFPFLLDPDTLKYVRKSKVMFVLRGLPGSGKSVLAEILRLLYSGSVVCSADDFFLVNGEYVWKDSRLKEAHESCHQEAQQACAEGRTVIVDNSNIRRWEMQFYFDLAQTHSYITIVVEPKTSWRKDIDELAVRTEHNITDRVLGHKLQSYETIFPIYYGWFLNETDSKELFELAGMFLRQCSSLPDFKQQYQRNRRSCTGCDAVNYYSDHRLGKESDILHCTAFFCDRGTANGSEDYASMTSVKRTYGRAQQLSVIGFFATPRTFGARVMLSPDTLPLWNNDDGERSTGTDLAASLSAALSKLGVSDTKASGNGNLPKITRSVRPTCVWEKSDVPAARFYNPCTGRGSRAHITLGCDADVQRVEAGLDLAEIIRLENSRGPKPEAVPIDDLAMVRNYGEGRWAIYLWKQLTFQTIFTGCY